MASSAFYKKVNSQMTLGFDQVQPLLEQLTAELSLSRPSDPIATMIDRLKEMEANIRSQGHGAITKARYDKVVAPRKMISIFGPACSGKTTQCSMALGDKGVILSPYELLNEAVNSGRQKNGHDTEIPKDLQLKVLDLMRSGTKAPTEILTRLLVNRIHQVEKAGEAMRQQGGQPPKFVFFLDGYPRTVEQALALEGALGELHCALLLFCPKDVCMKRMIDAGVSEEDRNSRWQLHEDYQIPLEEYWKAKKSLRVVDGSLDRNQTNMYVKSFIID
eukprot:gene9747-6835_t